MRDIVPRDVVAKTRLSSKTFESLHRADLRERYGVARGAEKLNTDARSLDDDRVMPLGGGGESGRVRDLG